MIKARKKYIHLKEYLFLYKYKENYQQNLMSRLIIKDIAAFDENKKSKIYFTQKNIVYKDCEDGKSKKKTKNANIRGWSDSIRYRTFDSTYLTLIQSLAL